MKKLSLSGLSFDLNQALKREELKSIFGGYDTWCPDECSDYGKSCTDPLGRNGTCKKYVCDGIDKGMCRV